MNIIGEVSQVLTLNYPALPTGQIYDVYDQQRKDELDQAADQLLDEVLTAGAHPHFKPRDIIVGDLAVLKNVKFVTQVSATETELKVTFVQYLIAR